VSLFHFLLEPTIILFCRMCKDYDLCSQCEPGSQNIHKKDHVFIALKNQADINIISEPLCRAYFY